MSPQRTPTAWGQGVRIVLICGILFVFWCIITAAIVVVFEQSILHAFNVAFAVLWGIFLSVFLGTWLFGRRAAGRVLLDCGPHPTRSLFLIQAICWLIVVLAAGFAVLWGVATSSPSSFGIGEIVFGLSWAAYSLIIATGRLQVRENGIWAYWGLLRWGKIGSYHWANDATLWVRRKGPLALFLPGASRVALPVPPEHKQAVEEFLAKHCPAQATA
jgi:hypothetical protein